MQTRFFIYWSLCGARHIVRVYRESYNLFAIQGWLFNHEGVRRGLDFVTRKITHGVACIKKSLNNNTTPKPLELGNIEAMRDWSDAEDFMEGVWLMLTQDSPNEYVLASGEMHSIREFLNSCLEEANIEWHSTGDGDNETYTETHSGGLIFNVNPKFYRPAEVHKLCGDPSLAEKELGWTRKTDFPGLVKKMYQSDFLVVNNY